MNSDKLKMNDISHKLLKRKAEISRKKGDEISKDEYLKSSENIRVIYNTLKNSCKMKNTN